MAPEFRPQSPRSHLAHEPRSHRADGASDLGRPASAARHRGRMVERGALVLPGDDPAGEPPQLALPTPALHPRPRVGLLSPGPQHAPRVAPAGPLPRLTVEPRYSRRWTPWQELCAALLEDAVKCVTRPPKDLRNRVELQRRADERWLDGVPAPLDFPTVCAVLDLEPTAVRRALRAKVP